MSLSYNGFFIHKNAMNGYIIYPQGYNIIYSSLEEAKKAVDRLHDKNYSENKPNVAPIVQNSSQVMGSNHGDKTLDTVLGERGNTYGSFEKNSKIAQELKAVLTPQEGTQNLEPYMLEAIHQILSKISRIVCGNPYYKDNWTDIAGYAKLVEDILSYE